MLSGKEAEKLAIVCARVPSLRAINFPQIQTHRIMKRLTPLAFFLVLTVSTSADPLRVFIRAGESNRGREVHAHPRFLEEWKPLLTERGMQVDGALDWPTA